MHYHGVEPAELAAALSATPPPFVIDVRDVAAFTQGHIPGSHHMRAHELANRRRELPPSKVRRIVVVGEPGRRAAAAANWLVLMGYSDVGLLDRGLGSYPGPLETGAPPEPPAPRVRRRPPSPAEGHGSEP